MKYAFQKMRLEAAGLVPLITGWADMKLIVTPESAQISGYSLANDIEEAFSALVLDWEAKIYLPPDQLRLTPGVYDLTVIGEDLYAARDGQKFLVPSGPLTVEVVALPKK